MTDQESREKIYRDIERMTLQKGMNLQSQIDILDKANIFHFLPIYSNPEHLSDQEALFLGYKVQEKQIDDIINALRGDNQPN